MWELSFWKNVVERALKTIAQSLVLVVGGNGFNWWDADWKVIVGAAATGGALSVLTSLASEALPTGNPGTASLTKAVESAPQG